MVLARTFKPTANGCRENAGADVSLDPSCLGFSGGLILLGGLWNPVLGTWRGPWEIQVTTKQDASFLSHLLLPFYITLFKMYAFVKGRI